MSRYQVLFAFVILVAGTLWCPRAHSAQTPDDFEKFCLELVKIDVRERRELGTKITKDLLRLVFDRGYFGQPVSQKVFSQKQYVDKVKPGRNVIFSIGPQAGVPSQFIDQQVQELKSAHDELYRLESQLKGFFGVESVDECLKKARASSFDPKRYMSLKLKESELTLAHQSLEASVIRDDFKKIKNELYLDWELIQPTTLEPVRQALQSPDVTNVIILTHATSAGQMIDSLQAGYPRGVFENLSPTLFSLSIYSCYGNEVLKYYKLSETLAKSGSIYGGRITYTAKPQLYLGRSDVIPLLAFRPFLKDVDHRLAKTLSPARLRLIENKGVRAGEPAKCTLSFRHLKVVNGEYGIAIGRHFLGALTSGDDAETVHRVFSCTNDDVQALKNDGVLVWSLGLDKKSQIDFSHPDFGARLTIGSQALSEFELELQSLTSGSRYGAFFREDGTVSSLRFKVK